MTHYELTYPDGTTDGLELPEALHNHMPLTEACAMKGLCDRKVYGPVTVQVHKLSLYQGRLMRKQAWMHHFNREKPKMTRAQFYTAYDKLPHCRHAGAIDVLVLAQQEHLDYDKLLARINELLAQ